MSFRIRSSKNLDLYKYNAELKTNLKNIIKDKKIPLKDISDHLGINQAMLSNILSSGHHSFRTYLISIDLVYQICNYIGATLVNVLPLAKESHPIVMGQSITKDRVKELEERIQFLEYKISQASKMLSEPEQSEHKGLNDQFL